MGNDNLIYDYRQMKMGKHGLPTWDSFLYPTLFLLNEVGHELSTQEIREAVVNRVGLPAELQNIRYSKTRTARVAADRVSWAISYATMAEALHRVSRGVYEITPIGQKLLNQYGPSIDDKIITATPQFIASKQVVADTPVDSGDEELPLTFAAVDEQISNVMTQYHAEISNQLLQKIHENDPVFFENLVVQLLTKMGYRGAYGTATVTQQSGDGGVDGIIQQDALGTRTIYVQAKRYKPGNNIGAPAIHEFAGTLVANKADKGVFITTSKFGQGALLAADTHGIITIDGKRLAQLMIEYSVGVRIQSEFKLVDIDNDFFDEIGE